MQPNKAECYQQIIKRNVFEKKKYFLFLVFTNRIKTTGIEIGIQQMHCSTTFISIIAVREYQ